MTQATVSFNLPTAREDGSALSASELGHCTTYDNEAVIHEGLETSFTVDLANGAHQIYATCTDVYGLVSQISNDIVFNLSPPMQTTIQIIINTVQVGIQ